MKLLAAIALAAALVWAQPRTPVRSHITVMDIDTRATRVVYSADRLFEAPNWSRDGKWLILNSGGRLWRLAAGGGEPEQIPTGEVSRINNDHGVSPDGKLLAISAGHIYVLPFAGGTPRQVTEKTPSYYHGWSPDGRTLAYCAQRDGNFDIYAVPAAGGPEQRLTSHTGYDDGPDYSPDGKWIYFNSDRSGTWDIWRIPASGGGAEDALAERITSDELEDWFPHPSPDGKWIVLISFQPGTKGHPENRDVVLRMMPAPDARNAKPQPRELIRLFGGQGTLNVNSWAPDSKRFAYVRYSTEQQ